MKYFLFLSFFFFYFLSHGQTCIIGKKTKNEIVVGADSKYLLTHTRMLPTGIWATIENMRSKSPESYAHIGKDNPFLSVLFFAFEGDVPRMEQVDVWAANDPKDTLRLRAGLQNYYGDSIFVIGHYEVVEPKLQLKETWSKGSSIAIQTLIKEVIAVYPDEVGLPIDVLRITKNKREWIKKKQICE